ncbi:amidohydro_3 domain-containing protein [Pycnococcus provasolii]
MHRRVVPQKTRGGGGGGGEGGGGGAGGAGAGTGGAGNGLDLDAESVHSLESLRHKKKDNNSRLLRFFFLFVSLLFLCLTFALLLPSGDFWEPVMMSLSGGLFGLFGAHEHDLSKCSVLNDDGTCASPWASSKNNPGADASQKNNNNNNNKPVGCPLGYGTEAAPGTPLPPGHPPVHTKGVTAKGRQLKADAYERIPQTSQRSLSLGGPRSIFVNGTIWTAQVSPSGLLTGTHVHSGLVVGQNGLVTLAGSETAARSLATPNTHVVDLQGKFVVPGFVDAHLHLLLGGWFLVRWCDLSTPELRKLVESDEPKQQDFVKAFHAKLASCAAKWNDPEGKAWVLAYGWDETEWPGEGAGPTQAVVDSAVGTRKAWAMRKCGHAGLASKAAREAASLPAWNGEPQSSLLVEADASSVVKNIPPPSLAEKRASLFAAQRHLHARGVTAVHDMGLIGFLDHTDEQGNSASFLSDLDDVLDNAQAAGKLALRIYAFAPLVAWKAVAKRIREVGRDIGPRLRVGGVKAFVDGSLGAETARFYAPYGVRKGVGEWATDRAWLQKHVNEASAARLQVALHAIGDEAVDVACEVLSAARDDDREVPRHRVEHAQHLSEQGVLNLRRARTFASMQPLHLVSDRPKVHRLGAEREARSFALSTLAESGVPLALGSDWFVADPSPLQAIAAAVDGDEGIDAEKALVAHTAGAARAGLDDLTGVLAAGSSADLVVLSGDPRREKDVQVLRTFVAGTEVWRAPSPEAATL